MDVNGFGDTLDDRAVVNGVQTTLDQFRGTPYIQIDLRVSRPFSFHDRWRVIPFVEFFNLFNRNNPGANYVTDISALPAAGQQSGQRHRVLPQCGLHQYAADHQPESVAGPGRRLGDFFGPGTTVGIPFAAQLGVRVSF